MDFLLLLCLGNKLKQQKKFFRDMEFLVQSRNKINFSFKLLIKLVAVLMF
jgi:hypothetical protein